MRLPQIIFLFTTLFVFHSNTSAQITQTIRGKVTDIDTRGSLAAATVALYQGDSLIKGANSDGEGFYRIEEIPVGRYTLVVSYIGYEQGVFSNLILTSGKELLVDVELQEAVVKMEEVEIVGDANSMDATNEMATLSARSFSVEETERYAGSRGDPARMVVNFAGIQGADDSRNDIVIRGNSPLGVVYRLQGADIPNPNHFSIPGSMGGPLSILNNKVLGNSDFFTGAFPAEYGNSVAGVFDIKMRNGNNQKHEFTGQFGFLGTELTAEGPLSKNHRSSYLVNYRYSTLTLFSFMGINIGTTAVPKYMDAAFKLNFPTKNGAVSFYGVGGNSDIDILISEQHPDDVEIYGDRDRDQYFGTRMGVVGMNAVHSFGPNTYMKFTLAQSLEDQHTHHEFVYRRQDSAGNFLFDSDGFYIVDSTPPMLDYAFNTYRTSAALFVNHKISARHVVKAGLNADLFYFDMVDSIYNHLLPSAEWIKRWDYQGTSVMIRPYVMWKFRINEKLDLNAGLHSQVFTMNNSVSPIEPRVGLKYRMDERNIFSAAFGMHSQIQPVYTYFYTIPDSNGNTPLHNFDMGFTKSNHYVIGYERIFSRTVRMRIEAYYQKLYNVPVTLQPSSFSLVNMGSGFERFFPDTLVNTGTSWNQGIEFSLVKAFHRKYFLMFTGAVYDSRFIGSDGVERPTDFNGNYTVNVLGSKEFSIGEKSTLAIGLRSTYAGNKRYGDVDTAATIINGAIVFEDSTRNIYQFPNYFRADLKVNYRINAKKVSHDIGLDLVNVTGRQNILKLTYAPDPSDPTANAILEEYQLGFLPIFYYRIDF